MSSTGPSFTRVAGIPKPIKSGKFGPALEETKVKNIVTIWKAGLGWGRNLHREAALDSLRNVLAVVGAATILADFSTIKAWLIVPMLGLAFVIWLLDYERHFRGRTVEETKVGQ
jgi:hypothetical protein